MSDCGLIEQRLGILVEMIDTIIEFMVVAFLLDYDAMVVFDFFKLVLSFYHMLYVC